MIKTNATPQQLRSAARKALWLEEFVSENTDLIGFDDLRWLAAQLIKAAAKSDPAAAVSDDRASEIDISEEDFDLMLEEAQPVDTIVPARIPEPPIKPVEPVYEDVSAQPDKPHDWYWPGHTDNDFCRDCRGINCDCGSSNCLDHPRDSIDCLRQQAWNRNWDREHEYKKALERYEAQMDYYHTLISAVVTDEQ